MADIHVEQQGDVRMHVSMIVNGSVRAITVEPRMTLLDALRDELALTGPKKSSDRERSLRLTFGKDSPAATRAGELGDAAPWLRLLLGI
jgi:hypothetical protein